uniref:BRCT domain-containing protein n=1 Tax=Trichuris muris TaxID=70415 RepID=A0A5S6QI96_TRIMR
MSSNESTASQDNKKNNGKDEERVRKSQDAEHFGPTIHDLAKQCWEVAKSGKQVRGSKLLNRKWIEKSVRQYLGLTFGEEVQRLGAPPVQEELPESSSDSNDKPAMLMVPKGLSEDEEVRLKLAEMHIRIPSIPRAPTPYNTLHRRQPPYTWNPAMRYKYQTIPAPVQLSVIPSHSGDEKY